MKCMGWGLDAVLENGFDGDHPVSIEIVSRWLSLLEIPVPWMDSFVAAVNLRE